MFDSNSGFMYVLTAIVIAFVIIMAVYFLYRAMKRAKELGMDMDKIKKMMVSTAVFTIAPAVSILLGVIALSKSLGFPFPWLRLSVLGALTYETSAAASAASVMGASLSNAITDPEVFVTIAWVMTLGIIVSPIFVCIFGKKIEGGITKIKNRDSKWGDIFMDGLFLGMISAFLGVVFADVSLGLVGWIPVFVMIASAIIMLICGALKMIFKAKWIEDYALPISLLGGMALSLPITDLVNSLV